jgi:hypothetical protein
MGCANGGSIVPCRCLRTVCNVVYHVSAGAGCGVGGSHGDVVGVLLVEDVDNLDLAVNFSDACDGLASHDLAALARQRDVDWHDHIALQQIGFFLSAHRGLHNTNSIPVQTRRAQAAPVPPSSASSERRGGWRRSSRLPRPPSLHRRRAPPTT